MYKIMAGIHTISVVFHRFTYFLNKDIYFMIPSKSAGNSERFDFTISHVPGKSLMTADTLSQAPLKKGLIDSDERNERHKEDKLHKEAEAYVRVILICIPSGF